MTKRDLEGLLYELRFAVRDLRQAAAELATSTTAGGPHVCRDMLTQGARAWLAAQEQLEAAAQRRGATRARVEAPALPRVSARLLTVTEAAEELRCSTRQVRRLIAVGRLRAARATERGSSRVLIERTELERYLRLLFAP